MALAAYRQLLRATKIAFDGLSHFRSQASHKLTQLGDFHLLHAARVQAREGFDRQRSLPASSKEAAKGIEHAQGVAQVLRHNVVQGKLVDGTDIIKLRIHEDTEKGDNDTIKNPLAPGGKAKIGGV